MASQNLEADFFKNDTPHGYIKRLMYKKYLQAYIAKTQTEKMKYSYNTVIIDGFAGAGRYGDEWPKDIESYGSPLIAIMVALEFCCRKDGNVDIVFGWQPSYIKLEDELAVVKVQACANLAAVPHDVTRDISLYFIENDENNYRKLKCNVQLLIIYFLSRYYPNILYTEYRTDDRNTRFSIDMKPFSISIAIFRRKFTEFDPPEELSHRLTRSLTFIDPFGYSHTPMTHVARFASAKGNEVFINFMSSYVNRFVSKNVRAVVDLYGIDVHADNEVLAMMEDMPLDDAVVEFVKHVIFYDNQPIHERRVNDVQKCSENYEEYLKSKTGSEFALSFELRGKGNAIIYHMIHTTHHHKGVEAMKESMNRCSQTEGQMRMSDFDIIRKGHKLNLGNCDNKAIVADDIFRAFKGRNKVAIKEISDFVWFDTPYVYRKEPLKILQMDGRITLVQDMDGDLQKQKNTFPDHTDWFISFA